MNEEGKKNNHYNINTAGLDHVDVDYITEELDMSFALGNVLKAVFGIAIEYQTGNPRHLGTGINRDINKAIHYLKLLKKRKDDISS